jgi:hypothetical protein
MIKSTSTLKVLADYFTHRRQVGHTTAMMEGAKKTDCVILVQNENNIKHFRKLKPDGNFITLTSLNDKLRGNHKPIVIDNAAMSDILSYSVSRIDFLESQIAELSKVKNKT